MPVTRSFFQRIPFIRITSLFLVGILLSHYIPIDFHAIGIVLTILLSILIFLWHNSKFTAIKAQNILISLGIVLSGIFFSQKGDENQRLTFDQKDYFLAEICQKPVEKANSYQSIFLVQSRLMSKPEKVIAYFSKEDFDSTIIAGDQLIILGKPQEIKNMGNPYEFDYRSMMQRKGIYHSVYLIPGTYEKTGIKISRLNYSAEKLRDKLIVLLKETKIEKEELSVVSALTLGYRTELEPETRDYFASTGAMHVLAVSGLHVGLIYLILNFLLSGLTNVKSARLLRPIALITFLWAYAFITGFSPSVQRATVMFTFVIIGNLIQRPINIYNSITASALVLMLHNPNVIFEVGFQLSYLAVFGIVLLQTPFASLLHIENKILKWLWALFTVSMAAQLVTFPLGILYFNQFPNFFWLSNFVVIPGAIAIIWITFGFFVFNPVSAISDLLSKSIQIVTEIMLDILKWISELPHAVSEGIVATEFQVWIIYGLITALVIYGFSKNKSWLFLGITLIIMLQINTFWGKYELFNQKAVHVYNSKSTVIHLINGRTNYILSNSKNPLTNQEMNTIQNVKNHLMLENPKLVERSGVNNFHTTDLKVNKQSIMFLNCQISFSKQLEFTIHHHDLERFINNNHSLVNKKISNTTLPIDNPYSSGVKAFSFASKYKEAVILSLN